MDQKIREIVASVNKPFRYIGGEKGSIRKNWNECNMRVCLVFPEIYEMGMSHLGISILYHIINSQPDMLAERAFTPWADMEAGLRAQGMPIFSLESHRPLCDFDIIGISLAYELTYTNVLNILDLAGIPLRAKDRNDSHPLIIAGGPCAFNPMPVAPFFDAIVIGDGEEVIVEILDAIRREKHGARRTTHDELSNIKGVYVPSFHNGKPIGMARIKDLNAAPFSITPITAYAATQERTAVEVARGCTRGCRFCQAGYIYRPQRQRDAENAAHLAGCALASNGNDEFSFLSLSIGDWAPLEEALSSVHNSCRGMPVNATLPSLRVESLTQPVIDMLGNARSGSFTLAPEAATERMRMFINKGNTDDDLYASVEKVFASGWHAIKLYFMLGLPGETPSEIDGIVKIANRCLDIGRKYHKRPDVTVSTSTFVPKAHTPFQWEKQITREETLSIQRELKQKLRRPGLMYRWHNADMSFLEGVFSRGGAELAPVIELAWRKGARFDGWDEFFNLSLWRECFSECNILPESYLAERPRDFVFPWEHLGAGPLCKFLWQEREQANELKPTDDCAEGSCSGCGICEPKDGLTNKMAKKEILRLCKGELEGVDHGLPPPSPPYKGGEANTSHESRTTFFRYRIQYSKQDSAAFLGHIETLDCLRRGFRAAGMPLCYSVGFHPRARIAAGPALSVGIESIAEFADIEVSSHIDCDEIIERTKDFFSKGISVLAVKEILADAPSIEESILLTRYEVDASGLSGEPDRAIAKFQASHPIKVMRERKNKGLEVDLRAYITELAVIRDGVLGIAVNNQKPALKISEIMQGLLGVAENDVRFLPVRKVKVEWKEVEVK